MFHACRLLLLIFKNNFKLVCHLGLAPGTGSVSTTDFVNICVLAAALKNTYFEISQAKEWIIVRLSVCCLGFFLMHAIE